MAAKRRKQKCANSFAFFRQQVAESKVDKELIDEILSLEFQDLRSMSYMNLIFFYMWISDALQSGKYTPSQVHVAYADVIGEINETYNCVTECIVESFDMAKSLEEKYKDSDEKPYLYGVPFSVKANFYVRLIFYTNLYRDYNYHDCS